MALDLGVLRALLSPFEIDIYVWLTWRLFRLRKPVTIPWYSLQLQFGCGYKNPRHFKRRFLKYPKSVISDYPEVRLTSIDSGLLLKPSPPHVPGRSASEPGAVTRRSCTKLNPGLSFVRDGNRQVDE